MKLQKVSDFRDYISLNTIELKDENNQKVIYDKYDIITFLQPYEEFYCDTRISLTWDVWAKTKWLDYLKIYHALEKEYNPIENYNKYDRTIHGVSHGNEETTNSNDITNINTTTGSGTTTSNYSSTVDNNIYTYDGGSANSFDTTSTVTPKNGATNSDSSTTSSSTNETSTNKGTSTKVHTDATATLKDNVNDVTVTAHTAEVTQNYTTGNIGVTSSQQMLEQEWELRRKSVIENYINEFATKHFFYGGVPYDIEFI